LPRTFGRSFPGSTIGLGFQLCGSDWPAVLIILSSFAIAKDQDRGEFCEAVSDSTATPDIGVIIRKVELSGDWGRNDALAYLPLKKIAEGGIVFSHSSIRVDNASVDLRPLAITLARAGATVIVPERW
jgi:hypothetical protein